VTTSNHDALYNAFQDFSPSEINITSTKTVNELKKTLAQAHFACLPYFSPKNQREQLISETMLAVKTVEYLSAGLPVLCNKYCGGASAIIDNNAVGISYDPDTQAEINQGNMLGLLNKETKERAIALAERLFDYKENAKRYAKLYQQLTNNE
jgi:glycosyltransferase involved in cell wall biosynthesis